MIDLYPFLRPLLHRLDPEHAHELSLRALELGILPPTEVINDPILATPLFGRILAHPLGLAAGFDKNARVVRSLFRLGFSWVEVGGVTPLPQTGNPRPRVFRLPEDEAVINRMGFPSEGAQKVAARLQTRPPGRCLGVNLAGNMASLDPLHDFVELACRFAPLAEYLTLDISCPNTANGSLFLEPPRLRQLLEALAASDLGANRPALIAKLSPNIDDSQLGHVVEVLARARIDAICIGNTTLERSTTLQSSRAAERGGLSGRPLFASSTRMLQRVYKLVDGTIPLIGTGGIMSGEDAYAKIRAGATALQLYTAMVYFGPAILARILKDLASLLRRDGFSCLTEAIGKGEPLPSA